MTEPASYLAERPRRPCPGQETGPRVQAGAAARAGPASDTAGRGAEPSPAEAVTPVRRTRRGAAQAREAGIRGRGRGLHGGAARPAATAPLGACHEKRARLGREASTQTRKARSGPSSALAAGRTSVSTSVFSQLQIQSNSSETISHFMEFDVKFTWKNRPTKVRGKRRKSRRGPANPRTLPLQTGAGARAEWRGAARPECVREPRRAARHVPEHGAQGPNETAERPGGRLVRVQVRSVSHSVR